MYSVVGIDGQTYGPVDMRTLQQWCAEGRIQPQTNLIDARTRQTFLAASLPELSGYLPQAYTNQQAYTMPPSYGAYPRGMTYAQPKSKVAAILLAFFLGGLGIHRFYLGHTGSGVAMLLITVLTCGYGGIITGIWALVDLVMIATGSLTDVSGMPLQ